MLWQRSHITYILHLISPVSFCELGACLCQLIVLLNKAFECCTMLNVANEYHFSALLLHLFIHLLLTQEIVD